MQTQVTAFVRSSSAEPPTPTTTPTPLPTDLLGLASFHCTSLLQLAQVKCSLGTSTTDADIHMLLFSASELCKSLSLLTGPRTTDTKLSALLAMPTILPAGSSTTTAERSIPQLSVNSPATASAALAWSPPSSPFFPGQALSPLSSAPSSPRIDSRSSSPPLSASHHHHHQFAKLIDKTKRSTTTSVAKADDGGAAVRRTRPSRRGPRQRAGGGVELPHVCVECLTSKTSQWRYGPHGPSTLCNACGLKWRKTASSSPMTRQRSSKGATAPSHRSPSAAADATAIVID